ncbi:MAG: GNAT family N-acetyltransferase [Candidatus Helarchaeota archaeon]
MSTIDISNVEINFLEKTDVVENLELLNLVINETHFLARNREISEEETYDFFNYWVETRLAIYLTAKYKGKIIGNISNRPREEELLSHIGYVGYVVHPDYRRQGVASLLMKKLIEYSIQEGYKILICEVVRENVASLALLKKFEFEQFGYLKNAFKINSSEYRDLIMLSKYLDK